MKNGVECQEKKTIALCQAFCVKSRNSVNRRTAVGQTVEPGRVGGQIVGRGLVEVFTGIFALLF